ncbi:MAG: hypothetical protein COV67_11770 [Nitrospinae bacterium CG11_big_fil_rev_8_21_14_0_20_56_8]|nr:MAG: hypothetical protein COV67_11770 [Nitrospinae bacterium CG11_big_fil_rev_8_21_14_0_20_56_8]
MATKKKKAVKKKAAKKKVSRKKAPQKSTAKRKKTAVKKSRPASKSKPSQKKKSSRPPLKKTALPKKSAKTKGKARAKTQVKSKPVKTKKSSVKKAASRPTSRKGVASKKPASPKTKQPVAAKKNTVAKAPKKLDPIIEKIKEKLVGTRSDLLKMIQSSQAIERNVGDLTFSNEIDLASSLEGREMMFQLSSRDRHELKLIEDALFKIHQGTYGQCESCSKMIGIKRLQILPLTSLCIDCQETLERS